MPARSKQGRVEWIQCSCCGIMFLNKDDNIHSEKCVDEVFDSFPTFLQSLPHCFIANESLFGSHTLIAKPHDHLPSGYQEAAVFLHPTTMKICHIELGQILVINGNSIGYAWPNNSIKLNDVGLRETLYKKLGDTTQCLIEKLERPHKSAASVVLKPSNADSDLSSDQFMEFLHRKLKGLYLSIQDPINLSYFGRKVDFIVSDCSDSSNDLENLTEDLSDLAISNVSNLKKEFFLVCENTSIRIDRPDINSPASSPTSLTLDDVGGLIKQKSTLSELLLYQVKETSPKPKNLQLPRGILLHGPGGTGKSLLAKAVTSQFSLPTVSINGPDIWSKFYGDSEAKLSSLFKEAQQKAPCVVIMDDLDALCPRSERNQNDIEKRVVATLVRCMDDLFASTTNVMLIATTNKIDSIEPSLRRPGRLDREMEIGIPSSKERAEIFNCLLKDTGTVLNQEDIQAVANQAHGFSGADLAAVCKEAGLLALRRCEDVDAEIEISVSDIISSLKKVQPTGMREVAIEVPEVKWEDIGGQEELKHKLRQAVEWPLKHPESFARLGIRLPRGLLMYGPPGCSKTMIAQALARESGLNFIAIKGPELFSKYVGDSEKAVRDLFRKARAAAPAIIFFDEIDALAGERGSGSGSGNAVSDRVLAQLLTEIDGVDALQDVIIVAATNRPDRMDKALLRPGRLDRIIYVPLPDDNTRKEILKIRFKKTPVGEDVSVDDLVCKTHLYSGAEVTAVCNEAALAALEEDLNSSVVCLRHFEKALQSVKPRITSEMIEFFDNYANKSGLHAV